jgi:hypothetical protein
VWMREEGQEESKKYTAKKTYKEEKEKYTER